MPITSPVASASGFPCSMVKRRAYSLVEGAIASVILMTILRRSSIGVAAHAGNAALAAATAASSWLLEARGHCASTSSVAGLRTGIVRSPGTIFPSIRRLKSLIGFALPFQRLPLGSLVIFIRISRLQTGDQCPAAHQTAKSGLDAVIGIDIVKRI